MNASSELREESCRKGNLKGKHFIKGPWLRLKILHEAEVPHSPVPKREVLREGTLPLAYLCKREADLMLAISES